MPLWADRIAEDSGVLGDFLVWIEARRRQETARYDTAKDMLEVAEARGAKKLLDELERYATMNRREEQVNARFQRDLERSTG